VPAGAPLQKKKRVVNGKEHWVGLSCGTTMLFLLEGIASLSGFRGVHMPQHVRLTLRQHITRCLAKTVRLPC
jgi:hypothetical protein